MELSSKSESSKPSKFKKNFLYKLFHKKKGSSRSSEQNINVDNNTRVVEKTKINILLATPDDTTSPVAATKVTEDIQSDKFTSACIVARATTESPSLSGISHITCSSDSMKRARELFFEPMASKSESDSGCPDEEKKQEEDSNCSEEFIKISSNTFKQLQNEVMFLRGQLTTLQKLFCSGFEDQTVEVPTSSDEENL